MKHRDASTMHQRYVVLLIILLTSTRTLAQDEGSKWTLQRAVRFALDNNISIRQGEIEQRLATLQFQQSKMAQLPSVNGIGVAGRSYGRSIDPTSNNFVDNNYNFLTLAGNSNVLLFGWFQQRNIITRNRLEMGAAQADLDQLRNDVSLNVATGYLRILLAWEQMVIAQKQIDLSQSQLNSVRRSAKAGVIPDLSVAQLEAQLATDSANMIISLSNTQAAVLELKALLNLDLATPFEVVPPPDNALEQIRLEALVPENIYAQAARTFGGIRAGELRIKAAERERWAARGALLPQLSATAQVGSSYSNIANNQQLIGYTDAQTGAYVPINGAEVPIYQRQGVYQSSPILFTNQVSNNFRQIIGFNLNVPLFNGWQANYNVHRSKLNIEAQKLALRQATVKLKQESFKANNDVVNAIQTYNAAKRANDASARAFSFAQKRFNVGLNNTVEYLTILNTYYESQSKLLSAKYDLIFKMKVIDYYTGHELTL